MSVTTKWMSACAISLFLLPGVSLSDDCNSDGIPDECQLDVYVEEIAVQGGLSSPIDVEWDGDGNMIVLDAGVPAVLRVAPDGGVTTVVSGSPLSTPLALAIDADGDYVVPDPGASYSLFNITPGGVVTTLATSAIHVSGAYGVTVDSSNYPILGATVSGDGLITLVSGGSTNVIYWGDLFSYTSDITIDPATGDYIVSTWSHDLMRVTPAGTVSTIIAGPPTYNMTALGVYDATGDILFARANELALVDPVTADEAVVTTFDAGVIIGGVSEDDGNGQFLVLDITSDKLYLVRIDNDRNENGVPDDCE